MEKRRQFLKTSVGFLAGLSILFNPLLSLVRRGYAGAKRIILPKGTDMESLTGKNPRSLDTRNLDITPLKDFDTMGITDHEVDLDRWRLHVTGLVDRPLALTYSEVKELPSLRKKVLLICPGIFAIHGDWAGISVEALLEKAGMPREANHVSFTGPEGTYAKVESFTVDQIRSEKVFLAYEVNGKPLPQKHGFPLRLVAEDHYGSQWVKYVYQVEVKKI